MVASVIVIQISIVTIVVPSSQPVSTNSEKVSYGIPLIIWVRFDKALLEFASFFITVAPLRTWEVLISNIIIAFLTACNYAVSALGGNTVAFIEAEPASLQGTT